jgi:hypothetical protein
MQKALYSIWGIVGGQIVPLRRFFFGYPDHPEFLLREKVKR